MQAPLLGLAKSIYYVVKMTKIKIIKVVSCNWDDSGLLIASPLKSLSSRTLLKLKCSLVNDE